MEITPCIFSYSISSVRGQNWHKEGYIKQSYIRRTNVSQPGEYRNTLEQGEKSATTENPIAETHHTCHPMQLKRNCYGSECACCKSYIGEYLQPCVLKLGDMSHTVLITLCVLTILVMDSLSKHNGNYSEVHNTWLHRNKTKSNHGLGDKPCTTCWH